MALSNPTAPVLVSLTGNDIIVVIETTSSAQDFYALFIQVEESDRATPTEAWSDIGPELRVPVDSNNQSEFRIQDVLKKEFLTHITAPSSSLVKKLNGYVRKYRYKYYERYGANQIKFNETTSGEYYAVQGGIGHLTEKKYNHFSQSWWGNLLSSKFFLTDMPQNKITNLIIGSLQREKLFFYNFMANGFEFWVKAYFTDKNPEVTKIQDIGYDQHEIFEIQASYLHLGIDEPTLYSYEVWLEDINGKTESRFFTINNRYYRNQKYFLYDNKYNISENRIFTGEYSEKSEYTKLKSLNISSKELSEYDILEEIPKQSATGLISREWLQHLREFYLALKKYEIYDDIPTDLIPINFDSKKIDIFDSEGTLYNHMLKYRYAFSSNFNDNGLFISATLTAPVYNATGSVPANGATGVVKFSTSITVVDGIGYPGTGNIKLIRTSDSFVEQSVLAKDCIFVRDEGGDSTQVYFVIYNTLISTEYEIVVDSEAIINKNGFSFYKDPAAIRKFTMGTNSDVVDFTANYDELVPEITITRTVGSPDARDTVTIVKLVGLTVENILQYNATPWENITINNNTLNVDGDKIDLNDYSYAEITVTDYAYGVELSSESETLYIISIKITDGVDNIFKVWFDEETDFILNNDGTIQELTAPAGQYLEINQVGESYSVTEIAGKYITNLLKFQIINGSVNVVSINKDIELSLVSIETLISSNVLNILENKSLENLLVNETPKVDLTGTDNISSLFVGPSEIGLNGDNYKLLDLLNKPLSDLVELISNNFTSVMVDYLLDELDNSGAQGGVDNIASFLNNAIPTAAGLVSKANLEAKGWTVNVDS